MKDQEPHLIAKARVILPLKDCCLGFYELFDFWEFLTRF